MKLFSISATDFQWIKGDEDDPQDLCLHGHATARIGDEIFEYDATVSATALYLLKSVSEDHIINQDNQMLPCCGFNMWPKDDGSGDVFIAGCVNGVDWSVIHEGNRVKLITETGKETLVKIEDYKEEVFRFADSVEDYYKKCTPKILPEDEYDREGYLAFWKEWHRRRKI